MRESDGRHLPRSRILLILAYVCYFCTAPVVSRQVESVYRGNTQLRVQWTPLAEQNVQHYEVRVCAPACDINAEL
jgi:hypothetical protein